MPIGSIVKWGMIAGILASLIYVGNRIYEYHLDQIDKAVIATKVEVILEQSELRDTMQTELREESRKDKEKKEQELKVERKKVGDLQRMLLIDHDLDRLLQRKPGRILTRVNRGTEEYFKSLEEITQ
jgi:hypothetical protein